MVNRIAVSIGNTRIASAAFLNGVLERAEYALSSEPESAAKQIIDLGHFYKIYEVALCSVVPPATATLLEQLRSAKFSVTEIRSDAQKLVANVYPTLGADRLANAAAALKLHATDAPVLVLDFGTATTLTAVNPQGEFVGGLITLGLGKTLSALNQSTAQLPNIRLGEGVSNVTPLANDTQSAITSGCLLAHIGIVEYWVAAARRQLGGNAKVVATGGYSSYVASATGCIDVFDQQLTLKGIKLVADHMHDSATSGR